MTGGRANGGGHLDEGMLLRAIDRQLAPDERTGVEAHLASCPECATARDDLARIAARVTGALDASIGAPAVLPRAVRIGAAPRPRALPMPRWLMAASLVLFALLATLAFPQGRAWASELWRRFRPSEVAPTDTIIRTADPVVRTFDRVLVEVTPTDPVMVLDFASARSAGVVNVEPHASTRLVLRSLTSPPVLVFPSALRVNNDSTPQADFRVLVPPTVQALVVRVQGREVCRAETVTISSCRIGSR